MTEDKEEKNPASFSSPPNAPSPTAARSLCTFGLIVSCRYADQEPIVDAVMKLGGRVIYRIPSTGQLFILRRYEVEKALKGDLVELQEIYDRKMKVDKEDEVKK